jgi:hypothetical protein
MSNVAMFRSERPDAASACEYLGPAEVVNAQPLHAEVALPNGRTFRAAFALAFPYEACPGDTVLAIGGPGGYYVIGVLHGAGRTVLELQGDVDLRAVGGSLRLSADEGLELSAPRVDVRTGKLGFLADAVTSTFTTLRQRVRELWSVQAGTSHTVVEGAAFSQSKSATMLTEEKMTLNGKAIHLG